MTVHERCNNPRRCLEQNTVCITNTFPTLTFEGITLFAICAHARQQAISQLSKTDDGGARFFFFIRVIRDTAVRDSLHTTHVRLNHRTVRKVRGHP